MKVQMTVAANRGYAPDQVEGMRLGDLHAAIEEAIAEWGADAELVTYDDDNRYGACYGTVTTRYGMVFEVADGADL